MKSLKTIKNICETLKFHSMNTSRHQNTVITVPMYSVYTNEAQFFSDIELAFQCIEKHSVYEIKVTPVLKIGNLEEGIVTLDSAIISMKDGITTISVVRYEWNDDYGILNQFKELITLSDNDNIPDNSKSDKK